VKDGGGEGSEEEKGSRSLIIVVEEVRIHEIVCDLVWEVQYSTYKTVSSSHGKLCYAQCNGHELWMGLCENTSVSPLLLDHSAVILILILVLDPDPRPSIHTHTQSRCSEAFFAGSGRKVPARLGKVRGRVHSHRRGLYVREGEKGRE
jgi:hypothetical protein